MTEEENENETAIRMITKRILIYGASVGSLVRLSVSSTAGLTFSFVGTV